MKIFTTRYDSEGRLTLNLKTKSRTISVNLLCFDSVSISQQLTQQRQTNFFKVKVADDSKQPFSVQSWYYVSQLYYSHCINYVQYESSIHLQYKRGCEVQMGHIFSTMQRGCAVRIRHIISTSKDVQYERGTSSVQAKMCSTN